MTQPFENYNELMASKLEHAATAETLAYGDRQAESAKKTSLLAAALVGAAIVGWASYEVAEAIENNGAYNTQQCTQAENQATQLGQPTDHITITGKNGAPVPCYAP